LRRSHLERAAADPNEIAKIGERFEIQSVHTFDIDFIILLLVSILPSNQEPTGPSNIQDGSYPTATP
jgi:hypothetical protein